MRILMAKRIAHKMEGKQVILSVEKVNEELGEIVCVPVAVSGDEPFIELKKDVDYTVTESQVKPIQTDKEKMDELMRKIYQTEMELFNKIRNNK